MSDTNVPVWIPAAAALGGVVVGLFAPWISSVTVVRREREA
jgi:hypothetical protein